MNTFKKILINNYLIICYVVLASITELLGIIAVGCGFGFYDPRLFLTMILLFSCTLFLIKNNRIRYYFGAIFLLIQGIINIFCIVLFEMTGTLFDFGMFKLRNDAMGILEAIPLNFLFIFTFTFLFVLYLLFAKRYIKYIEKPAKNKLTFIIPTAVLILSVVLNSVTAISINSMDNGDYTKRLYVDAQGKYKELGMTSNFINELYRGFFFNNVKLGDPDELESYIYDKVSTPTSKFGISEGNNVITVLVESMEWYSFINDPNLFPNGTGLTDSEADFLFPNLRSFYNKSCVLNNFYAREKTDISENLSIVGSYPSNAYINYDFPKNTNPFTLPNILKQSDSDILCKSYHNGSPTFYNRTESHKAIGFESFTACDKLFDMGMKDWESEGNRNLDSEMITVAKDKMFPTDKRFYTYITSITMHGMYYERENLKRWYEKIDSIDVLPKNNDEDAQGVRNYVAAVMEFDNSLGLMIDDLKSKNLLDTTTIVLFGDHNTYYQGLSNYVKNIYSYNDDNYTNLYRVACMIYDKNLPAQTINKFTTITDFVPTLLDLLGIKYYSNLYFGNSIFSDEESILYSRAYNIFLTDKVYFYSINNILYKADGVDKNYIKEIENKAKILLTKLEAIDKIFYHDFFKNSEHYNTFIENMKKINGF